MFLDPAKIEADKYGNRVVYGGETIGILNRDRNQFLVDKGTFSNKSKFSKKLTYFRCQYSEILAKWSINL
jgi:hypothetical protein